MNLKKLLTEATKELYHFTDFYGFLGIINSGYIAGNKYDIKSKDKAENEIAFTRKKDLDKKLSSTVGNFRFKIKDTNKLNLKKGSINELPKLSMEASKDLFRGITNKQNHIMLSKIGKELKKQNHNFQVGKGHKQISLIESDKDKFKEIAKKVLDDLAKENKVFTSLKYENFLTSFYNNVRTYYLYTFGKLDRESEERIIAEKIPLSPKTIELKILPGFLNDIKDVIAVNNWEQITKSFRKALASLESKVDVVKDENYEKLKNLKNKIHLERFAY
ncbi:MAG: hypothetical protein ACOC3Z_02545 [Nanoarchaeota archaeon]